MPARKGKVHHENMETPWGLEYPHGKRCLLASEFLLFAPLLWAAANPWSWCDPVSFQHSELDKVLWSLLSVCTTPAFFCWQLSYSLITSCCFGSGSALYLGSLRFTSWQIIESECHRTQLLKMMQFDSVLFHEFKTILLFVSPFP